MIELTNLESFTEYAIRIKAVNFYTPAGAGDLHSVTCTTQPTGMIAVAYSICLMLFPLM